jgi:C-terminal processing protease CtpA/Prc
MFRVIRARSSRVPLTAVAISACAFPLLTQGPPPLSTMDRQRGQLMLRHLKEDIEKHYYDPGFRGVDLKKAYAAAEEKVRSATTLNDVYAILTDFAGQLNDSHTVFFPPERRARVQYGWRMKLIGDAAIIDEVTPGSDAAQKGVAIGDRVVALNRFQPDRTNLRQINLYYRAIRPQAMQRLTIRKPDGTERSLDVSSKVVTERYLDLTDLLNEFERAIDDERDRSAVVGKDILVWRMPGYGDPGPVEAMLRKARAFKTLVLDLRDNGGGRVDTLEMMVGWFFSRELVVSTEKERRKETVARAKPRKEPFIGNLIVLVDSATGSAAEVFARVMQIEKRGRVIGDRTAGAVMTARMFSHSLGVDSLTAFYTMVTVGDVRMSDGGSLERVGVQPDEIALPTPADLAAKRDPVLARAIALAGGSVTPEDAWQMFRK